MDTTVSSGPRLSPLPAASIDFQTLLAETSRAATLKTEDGQQNALDKAIEKALLSEAPGSQPIAVPEGCMLQEVVAMDGRKVTVAVAIPAEDDDVKAEAKDPTPPAPPTPNPAGGGALQTPPATSSSSSKTSSSGADDKSEAGDADGGKA